MSTVIVERAAQVVTITLNNPQRRNVLTAEVIATLTRALSETGESDAKGVILAANGPVFCAGHDFAEMAGRDLVSVRRLLDSCAELMATMQLISQPVVARVHALATGAGCQLVATADLVVASEEATFCAPGGRGGLFCTTPMVAIGRCIGRKRALEMAMSGDPIDAATAAEWGLVNYVVPAERLNEATTQLVQRVTRGSAQSKGIGKRAFYAQMGLDQESAYAYATDVMASASQIPDAQAAMNAFLDKKSSRDSDARR